MRWLECVLGTGKRKNATLLEKALSAANSGDYAAALEIWEPLARAGVTRAQNNIGACFAGGLGIRADIEMARGWLKLAADGGDPVGQRNFAALHMRDASADFAVAFDYYRRAAEQGDAQSQDMLSWMLLEGEIVPADRLQARMWAEKAASSGVASSMTRLGMLYHNATGVERDPARAVYWWRRAAERGDPDGQAMFGAALNLGMGVERDGIMALSWLLRARAGGSELSMPFVGPTRNDLSTDDIAEAERRAARDLREVVH